MDTVAALLLANLPSQPAVSGGQAVPGGPSKQFDAELLALLSSHVPSPLVDGLVPSPVVPAAQAAAQVGVAGVAEGAPSLPGSAPMDLPAATSPMPATAGRSVAFLNAWATQPATPDGAPSRLAATPAPASDPSLGVAGGATRLATPPATDAGAGTEPLPLASSAVAWTPEAAEGVSGLPEAEARGLVARLVAQAEGAPAAQAMTTAPATAAPARWDEALGTAVPGLAAEVTAVASDSRLQAEAPGLPAPLRAAAFAAQGLAAGAGTAVAVEPGTEGASAPTGLAGAADGSAPSPRPMAEAPRPPVPEATASEAAVAKTPAVEAAAPVQPEALAAAAEARPRPDQPAADTPGEGPSEDNAAQPAQGPAAPDQAFAEEHPQPWGSRAREAVDEPGDPARDELGARRLAARPKLEQPASAEAAPAAREPRVPAAASAAAFRVAAPAEDTAAPETRTVDVASRDLDGEMPELLAQQARLAQRGREQELRVRVRPPELGEIRVVFRVRNGELTGSVTAERDDVRGWLAAEAPSWREELAAGGLKVARIDVGLTPQGDAHGQPQPSHGDAPRSGSQAAPGPAVAVPDEMSEPPQPALGVNAARHAGRIDYLA